MNLKLHLGLKDPRFHVGFNLSISGKLALEEQFRQSCSAGNVSGVIASSEITNEGNMVMDSVQEHHVGVFLKSLCLLIPLLLSCLQ